MWQLEIFSAANESLRLSCCPLTTSGKKILLKKNFKKKERKAVTTQSNRGVKHVNTEHEWQHQEQNKSSSGDKKACHKLNIIWRKVYLHFIMHTQKEKFSAPTPKNHHFLINWGRTFYNGRQQQDEGKWL